MPAYKFRDWWNIDSHKVSIAAPPKCGNTTVKRAVWRRCPRWPTPRYKDKYWLCRPPVERFKSFYANKILRQGNHPVNKDQYDREYGRTPEEVFERIKRVYENPNLAPIDYHWKRQSEIYNENCGNGSILVPLWRLDELLPAKRQNQTNSGEISLDSALEAEIAAFYADDAELYEKATQTGKLPRITNG